MTNTMLKVNLLTIDHSKDSLKHQLKSLSWGFELNLYYIYLKFIILINISIKYKSLIINSEWNILDYVHMN